MGAELRRVHDGIRDLMESARDGVLDADPVALQGDLLIHCLSFCSALDGHHRAEDAVLFPWLLDERPDLAPVVRRLEQDHSVIATLLAELREALGEPAPASVVLRHLEGLDAIMENHFRFEERRLVDVLDASDGDRLAARRDAWSEVPDAGGAPDERLARGGGHGDR